MSNSRWPRRCTPHRSVPNLDDAGFERLIDRLAENARVAAGGNGGAGARRRRRWGRLVLPGARSSRWSLPRSCRDRNRLHASTPTQAAERACPCAQRLQRWPPRTTRLQRYIVVVPGADRRRRSPGEDTLRADPRRGRPRRRTSVCRASPRGAAGERRPRPGTPGRGARRRTCRGPGACAGAGSDFLDAGRAAEPRHAHPAGGQRPPTPHDGFARRSTRPTHRYRTAAVAAALDALSPAEEDETITLLSRGARRSAACAALVAHLRGLRAPHPGAARRGAHRPRGRSRTDAELAMIALRELTAEPVLPTCRSRTAALGPAGRDGFARQLNVATGTADRAWWDAFRALAQRQPRPDDWPADRPSQPRRRTAAEPPGQALAGAPARGPARRLRCPSRPEAADDFCAAIGTWLAERAEQSTDAQAEDLLARMRGIERIGFEPLVDRLGPRHRTTARHRHPARGRAPSDDPVLERAVEVRLPRHAVRRMRASTTS